MPSCRMGGGARPARDGSTGTGYHKGTGVARDDREAFSVLQRGSETEYLDYTRKPRRPFLPSEENDGQQTRPPDGKSG